MAKITPMQRTLKWLREQNIKYDIVESYNAFSKRRKDLFGIIDVVALHNKRIIGIQVCGADWSPHIKKIKASPFALKWAEAGELWLVGWRELKSGWKVQKHIFTRGDLQNMPSHPLNSLRNLDMTVL
ncbi:hypothetical protein LCGC14_2627370 [marine sediment metagenome]|uniref:Uncharacterized protein n=1 Tax=marine sediment metagenome TaxID=412755 RepID=A0A0F9A178_9ZZZZ